jgi:hypothetical protein
MSSIEVQWAFSFPRTGFPAIVKVRENDYIYSSKDGLLSFSARVFFDRRAAG